MSITNFRAKHGTLAYATGAVTWDTPTALANEAFTADMAEVKDITITPPEQAYEKIDCIGATAQTVGANAQTVGSSTGIVAGTFQNQAVQLTASGMWMISGTLVMTGDEQIVDLMGLGTSAATSGGSKTRRTAGTINASTRKTARSTIGSLRFFLNNGAQDTTVVLSNVYMNLGEIKPTGADGYFERTFEAHCLAKDGAIEFLD